MKNVPITENALIVRTDFSNKTAWDAFAAALRAPHELFILNMEFLEDRQYERASVEQLIGALPEVYPHTFLMVADAETLAKPDYPLLVVDLFQERGRQFRASATCVSAIENNLSIGNMGFEEFEECVDETGVFRGFPGM